MTYEESFPDTRASTSKHLNLNKYNFENAALNDDSGNKDHTTSSAI